MSPESEGLLKFARDRFYKNLWAFEFRISFSVSSRTGLSFVIFLFELKGRSKEVVIVFILDGESFGWRLTETSHILHGLPYWVSRIGKASVFPCAGSNKTQGSKFLTGYPSQAENQVTLSLIFSWYSRFHWFGSLEVWVTKIQSQSRFCIEQKFTYLSD